METTKKLSLDDIFGKVSAPASSEAVKSIDDIFGQKEAATPVAPYGTMTDEIRGVSHAPADLIGVSPQPAIIGENELQKNRAGFEEELKSMAGAIQPTQESFKPMSADAFKVGGDVTMPGDIDKPKSLSQTVQSEIDKRWGGNLQSIIDKARSVNPENVNLAEDMESHFWEVMKDKVPSDSFITQEDLDGFKFTRDYSNGDKDIEYSFGHYTYPQEVVNEYVARHNDEVLHNMRFKEEPEYRNEWFLRNVGVTEQAYRDEVAADLENRLHELRKKIVATLPAQHTRGGYAAIGAAANKPSSGASVSIEKIDKALKTVNTLRKNSFGAGLKEGFDFADILTLGVSGIGENVALLNALNKSASGKTLTTSEQALVEAWDIQNEAEEVMQVLGGRSLASNIGRGGAQSLGFITQTVGTGGLASAATKGITRAAAKSALKRVASTGVASKIQEGVRYGSLKAAESLVGAAARTPFMGFTYRNYTDKRLNQFQINERVDEATSEISKYIDKQESSALRDAAHAALESYFESQSEDVGGLIDFGITSFARALPIKQFIRSSVVNGMTGAVKNGAMKWIKESAKIYGLAGEVLSEAYGDAAVNLLTSNTDGWKQMASSEYWWELLGVSSMLSGGFGVVNRAVNSYSGRNLDRQIAHEDNNRRNALSRIEDDMLKKELTEVSLTDDLIERSKMLSSLDWSNFTKEDMANTIDFISAQTRLDVMRESDMESRRLARIMPAIDEVKTLADNGALDEDQSAASLAVIYSDLFRTQENQRALNILTDRIKVAADAGISADEINEILRGAGLTVFNPGDEIETLTGDRAIVDKVLPGAYEVVNNEGGRAVVSFEEVLQNTPEVRQIQQESNQTEGQPESAPENNSQVEQAVESARQEAEVIKNLDDDVIYEATLSDGTPVNIIKGANIVYNNQTGEVDYDASDATVVVRSNDGSKRQISIREIDSIDQAMSVDEALEVATAAATEVVNSQEQAGTPTAEVASTQAEVPSVQEAEAATVEQSSESPANQPEEQPQIPLLKNGEPDYNAMDARMFAEQYVTRFGEGATERIARNNIKASNKTISTIEKQIEDVTDPNKMPALYSKLQDAQATKDKYSAVLEELGLSADESEDNAARIQRKKQENTPWFNKLFPDGFPNVESVILWDIANGNRIRWTNKEVNGAVVSKGLGSHLGLVDSNAERTRRVALIGKDAPTPEEYAEQLPERLNAMGIRFEESELLDKVLDVYASVDTVRKAKEELEKISANIQAEQEGLDYEEEQMRRNYEREQEALRQEAQADVVDEQTEQEQPTNEEIQEEELSIEDEVPFMISGNPLASETTEAVMSSAKNEFEETDDWSLTGWLLPDGTQLSFSEEGGYERDIDHRAIGLAYAGSVDERWKYLQDFEQRGGIRVSMNYGSSSIELSVKPTSAQFSKLSSFIRESGGNVDIDFMDENYNTSHSASYDSVNSSRVLSDIERYFDEGIKPSGNVSFEIAEARRKNKNEAQLLATEAAITALEDAGVEVVNATPEMVEEALQRKDVQMQAVNQKFNEQLDSFTEENANAVIFDLGMPSPMLIAGGVPNKPIRLYGSKLLKKIRKHGFSAAELSELPMALANPIAVFNNYQREGNRSVLIELSTADGNFLVSIDIGAGSDIDFDIVKSVFGKDGDGILNWINKGYLTIVDKEKALAYLRISAPIAEASNKQELDSATKIVENFENPKIEPDNSFSIGSAPVFVSNAKIAVLGIKQEKATPEQWLKMIEKAGGLKAGEDKWIGLSDWLKSQMRSVAKEKPTSITINGVEYKVKELENQILSDIRGSLEDNGFDVDLVGIRLVGSYVRGEQHEGSDIDVIVEYKGNSSEDTLFDVLNDDENRIRIEGVDVDVNPITEGKSGTLDEWEKRNAGFTKRPATLTKQDVLDYINENQIQIEETTYSSNSAVETTPEFKTLQEEFKQLVKSYEDKAQRNLDEYEAKLEKKYNFTDVFDTTVLNSDESKAHSSLSRAVGEAYNAAWVDLVDQYGDDFEIAFWRGHDGIRVDNAEAAGILLGLPIDRPIYHLREDFTTKGLEGNREIALTVPTIEPWNENDEVHFGDAGGGRAIAWVRFGETTDEDGKRVLVIDEIQSKRHQEGREKGYISGDIKAGRVAAKKRLREAYDAAQEYRETLKEKYNWDGIEANSFSEHVQKFTALLTPEEIAERERLDEEKRKADEEWDKYDRVTGAVPEAPFEKNWAELAMKRMLRYAAENGFDKVAWTKGDQQAERYNLSKSIDYIEAKRNENGTYDLDVATVDDSHFVEERGVSETRLSELVGKEIALSIVKETQENKDGKTTIEGDNLRIGGEGMRAFYNQMLPSFMRKYGKKWGATVQDVTLPYVEEAGRTMHSVDVTDSMRESVMQGQPVFYRRPNGTVYGWTNGTTVYLTESGMNPNTPIHEYTHIWADAMRKHNPEGWKSIVKLLKGTPVWNEVMADTNYANIHSSENQVTSEALSRISGRENSAKMEAVAQQMIDENANDTVKKNRARKLLDRMRKALQEFWSWVGKELFGIKNFESIEQVSDRILYDLVSGTDLTSVSSFDTPAAERNEIISKAKANGTYLKAPNGKDTNLTPEQWVTVRTKAFKRWFGDWENGGASSQILDANGEPLVVWHGGEFATDEFVANGSMHFGTKVAALQRILDNAWGYGNWSVARNDDGNWTMTRKSDDRWWWRYEDPDDPGYNRQAKKSFARPVDALVDAARIAAPKAVVRPYFLNIRNLERTDDKVSAWTSTVSFSMDAGYDGIIYRNEYEDEGEDSYVAFYPNQIKLADGSNTTFDPNDDDVRFSIGRNNESKEDFSFVEHKVTPLARLEAERDALLENRENNPNFEQEYAAIEERIREERETDRVALTIVDGLESEAHRVAVEDAVFDYVREHNLFASQVYVERNLVDFKNRITQTFPGTDVSKISDLSAGFYSDGIIVLRSDMCDKRTYAEAVLIHEYTHALTTDLLDDDSYYERQLAIAKEVGADYMIERLYPNYKRLEIEKSDDGLVAGLMEMLARDMEFVVRNGRLTTFLSSESESDAVLREYFERYEVPTPLAESLINIAKQIKTEKYGEEIDRRTHSEGEFVSTDTEWDNGTNLQPNARTDGERRYPGWFGTRTGATGTAPDEGGQVGGGTRGDRADLAESNQTAKSDSRARLIAELRQKLRDVKAETRTVAAEVGKIVRKAITAELIDKMGKRTFDNIVRTIEMATVRRDVEYAVNRIEEAVLDMELRDKQDKFDKYLNLRVQGESARGVSIAANVTDPARQFITIIRDNLDRPASEVEALIEERGGSLAERTGLQVLGFYQDARNFEREVQEIEDEIEKIKSENTELRKKRAALNKAGKTNDAKNLSDQINANKESIEHLNAERISTKRSQLYYIDMAANELEREIAYGKEGHKEWLQQEAERKQELIEIVWNDIGDGKDIPILDEQEPVWKKTKNAVVDFLLAPAYSWDYLLKMISVNAPNGEGALYDHFMRSENGYVAASGNYYQAYEDFKARLNEKAKDIFGKDYKQVLKDSNQPLDVTIQISAQGASEIYTPTIGEVVYAYMAAKMPDGRVRLDKMGVKEDKIDYLVRQIPQGYITFADWVQNEFLPERRKVYNKTHLEVFGTQMAQIENYVPLKVKKDFVYEEFDGSKIDKAELPSSITGSIIKRKRNSLPIDLHTNIFDLLLDHGQQMEHWNAYTRIVRDTNQFLSNTKIRRALDYRKKGLHKKLKEAALIASNSYQPDVDRLEKMTVALSKMVASSKIAFRINTAIKQVLSYPAFYAYVADAHFWGYLTRNLGPDTWGRNFRWALDNIPSFQERWLGRMAGDDRLAQMTSPQLDRWIKGMGNVGMLPNALVDAVTCANGAQAVYRYEHERYLKIGLDESEADRLAKIAAAQALNQTQQSSEGMYLSRIQADRTAFAVVISTFQNSNFAYLRKELEGIDQLMRDTKKQIANREKYYEQQGVNPDQAAKLALQDVVSANRTAVAKILVFGFILSTIWTLGNSVWKYAFGDEDEEDKWEDAAIRGFFNSFTRNLSVGQYVETVAWSDFRELNPSLLLSDLNMFIERLESIAEGNVKMWDRTAAWTVLSTLSSLGLGVDINSFASMYEGVQGAIDNGANVEDIMLLVNAPRSQAKFIAGPPKEGETLDEYIKRQAWIERKIVSRIDKKQLDKWSRNYEAYKQAEMLGVPYSRDKMGRVSVPYIKDIDDSYSALLKSVGRTKSGAKRNDGDSIADDVKTRIRDFGLIKRIKDINALEKNLDAMVILDGAYPERLKELCEAKQQLIEEWNQ